LPHRRLSFAVMTIRDPSGVGAKWHGWTIAWVRQ